jgi:hypothetical protein
MAKIVHARLDEESRLLLEELRRRTGLKDSEVVRRGIRALATLTPGGKPRRVIGLGRFASGIPDLGSDKRHLKGFGRS